MNAVLGLVAADRRDRPSAAVPTATRVEQSPAFSGNLEQLRPRSGIAIFSSSNRKVRRTLTSAAERSGRGRPAYTIRVRAEASIGRFQQVIGDGLLTHG